MVEHCRSILTFLNILMRSISYKAQHHFNITSKYPWDAWYEKSAQSEKRIVKTFTTTLINTLTNAISANCKSMYVCCQDVCLLEDVLCLLFSLVRRKATYEVIRSLNISCSFTVLQSNANHNSTSPSVDLLWNNML